MARLQQREFRRRVVEHDHFLLLFRANSIRSGCSKADQPSSCDEPYLGTIVLIMGTISSPPLGLAGALFSNVQQRLLALIFTHPDRSFYTRQIVKALHSGTGAVGRELAKLEQSGLVSVERI